MTLSFSCSPVDENKIGRWKFHLTARDRSGQSVGDVLEIVVRQYSGSRLVNHYFEIAFSLLTTNERKRNNWEWQVKTTELQRLPVPCPPTLMSYVNVFR